MGQKSALVVVLELTEGTLRDQLPFHFEVLACLRVIVSFERLVVEQALLLVDDLGVNHVLLVQ